MPGAELTVVGMGMIGASAALALRSQFDRISMIEPDERHAEHALSTGQADRRVDEVPADTDAVLLACPSDRIAGWIGVLEDYPATIMDTGSVKAALIREVRERRGARGETRTLPSNWVPCHPIAGLERSGPMVADANLFRDRKLILTPEAETSPDHIERARGWWRSTGALVEEMNAKDHDQIYARTSHLPHLLVFAYLLGIGESDLVHTGGGFRDFSRIGGSDPVMWSGIFDRNSPALLSALDQFEAHLAEFRQAIESGDMERCRGLIASAREARRSGEGEA